MKVEVMVYIYIAICVSLIVYNCVYIFVLKNRERKLKTGAEHFDALILEQIDNINKGAGLTERHKNTIYKKLKSTAMLACFDKSMEKISKENPKGAQNYIKAICPEFNRLAKEYRGRNVIMCAYFSYILKKYKILSKEESKDTLIMMLDFLHSDNVYCRENALAAIYSVGDVDLAIDALKIIDKNESFHHPKLVCDGLVDFSGDKTLLLGAAFEIFDVFSLKMQLNILNFARFSNVRCDEEMLKILHDSKKNQELRFAAIRYFEKFYNEKARKILQEFADGIKDISWQYQAIASSAIKNYPDEKTTEILKKNLSSSNWYVRLNSAKSCEELGYTYKELINIFDGNDRYAREILRYRLDRRQAEEMAVKNYE